jgi:hypothetical protein
MNSHSSLNTDRSSSLAMTSHYTYIFIFTYIHMDMNSHSSLSTGISSSLAMPSRSSQNNFNIPSASSSMKEMKRNIFMILWIYDSICIYTHFFIYLYMYIYIYIFIYIYISLFRSAHTVYICIYVISTCRVHISIIKGINIYANTCMLKRTYMIMKKIHIYLLNCILHICNKLFTTFVYIVYIYI